MGTRFQWFQALRIRSKAINRGALAIIGSNIKFYRKKLGLSQEQLADLADLHRTYVGSVERGERNISALNIEKLAAVLGVEPAKLLESEPNQIDDR